MKLAINHLQVHYGKTKVIQDLNLNIEEGCFFTILGESGSGKSTILKAIAGLLDCEQGQILVDGHDLTNTPAELRAIAYVFQKPLLFPHLNVADNIAFGPEIHGWSKQTIQERLTTLMGLLKIKGLEDRMPSQLSGGQQQRVAIARSLALNHKLLLMDEPFSSLDPGLREEMGLLVKDIQKELGLTVIFVTHHVSEAMALSDQIGFLTEGDLKQIGCPDTLYNYPLSRRVAKFMGDVNFIEGTIAHQQFTSSFRDLSTDQADLSKAYYLLRPSDIAIDPQGLGYEVLSSQRIGMQTHTEVIRDGQGLCVTELNNKIHVLGSQVGLVLMNDYGHIMRQ